ncbi:MAG: hypothetical protein SGI77_23680 [Pirellulaceae bacterium]|nr:hypothetical protein [Pirellulaceae bacterium]
MKIRLLLILVAILTNHGLAKAADHHVNPGDSPQAVLDQADAGDKLIFQPGLHWHGLGKHQSMLYIDKPIEIELKAGATLKLIDQATHVEVAPEVTTDHGAPKKLDDFQVGGTYDLSHKDTVYSIVIDGEGREGQPDTFAWGVGRLFEKKVEHIAITGDWQDLDAGVKIRFGQKTGHNSGSLWFISYDGPFAYGIRIGHGTQGTPIENVRIHGHGMIDMNASNNTLPSGLVKDINACVLIHGRVRNGLIEDITMTDTMRSVMVYGEHTGDLLAGGRVTRGESFDAENITIQYTRTINPGGSGYLLGHPSHRGQLRNVRCNYNYMETNTTSIEPNFQLDRYEVIGNIIKSNGEAIHCWRKSSNGLIADNLRIDDPTGRPVVKVNAPGGWENSVNIVQRNNRNHLFDRLPPKPAWFEIGDEIR